jgi:hypothetical protein
VGHLRGDRAVVVLAARRAGHRRLVQPPAQLAVAQLRQRRLPAGQHQGEQVPLPATLGGRTRGPGDLPVGQPVELRCVVDGHRGGLGRLLQVLVEGGAQLGQPQVQLAQPRAARLVQRRPGQHEVQVVPLDQAQLLGVQVGVVPAGEHRVHPGEERRVQPQGVLVGGRQRRELPLDLPDPVGGDRGGEVVEHPLGPGEQLTGPLEGDHRVLEGGLGRVGDDPGDLGPVLGHPREQCLADVLRGDLRERRELVRQLRRGSQRVRRGQGRGSG